MIRTIKNLWDNGRTEMLVTYGVTTLLILIAVIIIGDQIVIHMDAFEQWIESLGVWAWIIFVSICVLLNSVLFPHTVLGIIAGATFGFTRGLLAVACAGFVNAVLQYLMSRHLLKPVIDRMLASRPALLAVQHAVLKQQLRLQLLIRLTPLNNSLTSYVLGAAGVRFGYFLFACIGMLPDLCIEVYFGYAGKHLATVSQGEHTTLLHDAVLIAGGLAAVIVMVLISRTARRAVEEATSTVQ